MGRDTVPQKVFINFLCGITLRSTFDPVTPNGLNTADYTTVKTDQFSSLTL